MSNESIKSHLFVSRVSQDQFEKKIRWKIMIFFSPAFRANLVTENWSPSPRMKFYLFWHDSPKETNKPLKEIDTPVSKPFSITFATPLILRFRIPATHPFLEKYSEPVVLSSGKSLKKTQLMKSFSEHPIHVTALCWSLWPRVGCESVRCSKSGRWM